MITISIWRAKMPIPRVILGFFLLLTLIRFFGTVAERVFWKKKSKAQKHIQIFSMLRSGFFSAKHAR